MYFRHFGIISPWKRIGPFIWTNLNFHHPWRHCAKFGLNWPSGSGEEDFLISSMFFCYFLIISSWKNVWPFIWINLNSLHPSMYCAKFSWNWSGGSWEENIKMWKVYDNANDDTTTRTDSGHILIRKFFLKSLKNKIWSRDNQIYISIHIQKWYLICSVSIWDQFKLFKTSDTAFHTRLPW